MSLPKAAKDILSYLTELGPVGSWHTVTREQFSESLRIDERTVTRSTKALAEAEMIQIRRNGYKTQEYKVMTALATAKATDPVAPKKKKSKSHKAGALALAAAGIPYAEEVPYSLLLPEYKGKATADIVISPTCVIEFGNIGPKSSSPEYRVNDDKKRAACRAHGIEYFRCQRARDAKQPVEGGIRLFLGYNPRARATAEAYARLADYVGPGAFADHMRWLAAQPPPEPRPNDVSVPRGFASWTEYYAAHDARRAKEDEAAKAKAEADHAEWLAWKAEEPARLKAEAEAKARAEAKAYWGDMLDDDGGENDHRSDQPTG
jgi:hypothetical protein